MSDALVQTQAGLEAQPPLPVRRLHNFIYCPRLFYFQWVENIFHENADTVAGSHAHRNVDAPSKVEDAKELGLPEGTKIRSLKLESEALGLVGVVDIVEGGPDGAEILDYKRGSARRNAEGEREAKEPDAIQVAAHALLLREQGVNAVRGAIYYATDKRRVPVDFTEELFAKVRTAIADAKRIASSGSCPPPLKNDARCLYCSAYPSVSRMNRSGGTRHGKKHRRKASFDLDSAPRRKINYAIKFCRHWISPLNPANNRPPWNHHARNMMTAKCSWCKRPARTSDSAAIN